MSKTLLPNVLWAQRKDKIYLTIDVQDAREPKVELTENSLSFSGLASGETQNKEFAVSINFYESVDSQAEGSKVSITARNIFCIIIKKDAGHWPRYASQRALL
jgi:prostaglandin-E synthase